ncbi:rhodanese-like domain-containing protein [Syntrophotalea acetylenivorans]|nr:rhodanese-like domain-containing protein [Syntrophotalea acetylenivorans]
MKRKYISLLFVALLGCFIVASGVAQVDSNPQISGKVVNGLRLLTLVPGQENDFVIYRGDYIQPSISGFDRFTIEIPALNLMKTFPAKEGERAYIKMKNAGSYSVSAGKVNGTIKVIEYTAASYTELSAEQTFRLLQNTNPLVLDVRTPGEFRRGYLQGANLLPVQVLQQNISKLEAYKNQDILIYCATGNRSTVASRLLIESGFKRIYNLRYGISDWARRGYSVVR